MYENMGQRRSICYGRYHWLTTFNNIKNALVDSSFNFFHEMTPVLKLAALDVRGGSPAFLPLCMYRKKTQGVKQWVKKNFFFICHHLAQISKATGPVNLYLLIVKSPSYLWQGNIRTSVWESGYLLLSSPGGVWALGKNHCYLP